jgi:hypothetical protein
VPPAQAEDDDVVPVLGANIGDERLGSVLVQLFHGGAHQGFEMCHLLLEVAHTNVALLSANPTVSMMLMGTLVLLRLSRRISFFTARPLSEYALYRILSLTISGFFIVVIISLYPHGIECREDGRLDA